METIMMGNTRTYRAAYWRRILPVVALVIIQCTSAFGAQGGYEPTVTLNASQILPPDVLAGPHHRVQERVYNDGYLNTYRVDSKFGTFVAVSTAMLRKRIGEINALVRMEQIQNSKEYTSGKNFFVTLDANQT